MRPGRPKKDIDKKQFEYLCGLQCTEEEIAGVFDCDKRTVDRWCQREYGMNFVDVYKTHSANGKMSLRRFQFKLAERNAAMAIFLGKQYLGQRDIIDTPVSEIPDDGFVEALKGTAKTDWGEHDV